MCLLHTPHFQGNKVQESHHFPGIQRVKCPFSHTLHTCCSRRTSSCFSCRTSSASLCSTSSCCLRSATFLMCCRAIHRQLKGDVTEILSCVLSWAMKSKHGLYFTSSLNRGESKKLSPQARATQSNKILKSAMDILFPLPPRTVKQPFQSISAHFGRSRSRIPQEFRRNPGSRIPNGSTETKE